MICFGIWFVLSAGRKRCMATIPTRFFYFRFRLVALLKAKFQRPLSFLHQTAANQINNPYPCPFGATNTLSPKLKRPFVATKGRNKKLKRRFVFAQTPIRENESKKQRNHALKALNLSKNLTFAIEYFFVVINIKTKEAG